jgi:hypothetical protein
MSLLKKRIGAALLASVLAFTVSTDAQARGGGGGGHGGGGGGGMARRPDRPRESPNHWRMLDGRCELPWPVVSRGWRHGRRLAVLEGPLPHGSRAGAAAGSAAPTSRFERLTQ